MRYEKVSLLGRGSTSSVYLCRDRYLGRFAAAKTVGLGDPERVEMLRREYAILRELQHPGIPRALDYVESGEEAMAVETLLRGRPMTAVKPDTILRNDLKGNSRRLAWEALVASWGGQICQILDYLHRCDPVLIYGDLKPENLILTADGSIRLIDFGSVVIRGETGICTGTRGYAAPEQYAEEAGDPCPATDLYALGRVLEELAAGCLSSSFRHVIAQCLDPDPDRRCSSASYVGRRLNTIASMRRGEVFLRENW